MAHASATPARLLSVAEYLQLEETSDVKHEYVQGEVYALAGANDPHNQIAMNVMGHLWQAARGGPCRVYPSDMRLQVADDVYYYPDAMAVCDPTDTGRLSKSRPCLVVEVLSPSTAGTDRREKLLAYRGIASLRGYLMVYQDEARVEWHYRDEKDAWWRMELVGEGVVPIPCPTVELSLADIYEGVTLGRARAD